MEPTIVGPKAGLREQGSIRVLGRGNRISGLEKPLTVSRNISKYLKDVSNHLATPCQALGVEKPSGISPDGRPE
jgi:hypothetical protein